MPQRDPSYVPGSPCGSGSRLVQATILYFQLEGLYIEPFVFQESLQRKVENAMLRCSHPKLKG